MGGKGEKPLKSKGKKKEEYPYGKKPTPSLAKGGDRRVGGELITQGLTDAA